LKDPVKNDTDKNPKPMKDFFISYNKADRQWAEWIAWTLEEAGYSVVIQAWDFRPGGNFVLEMQQAAAATNKTIAVLTQNYLEAEYTQPEWAAAFVRDPQGKERSLIPIRVEKCQPEGLLTSIIYVDIVDCSEEEARGAILGAFSDRVCFGSFNLLFLTACSSGSISSRCSS
jgi:hypothetical protein